MSNITVAILAGGHSRRMGIDKSFVLLDGKPIFEHVLARTRSLDLPTILITATPEKYARYGLQMYQDVLSGKGALGGLYTAIQTSESDFTLCVACDMPFLNVALLKYLIELCSSNWDVVVPQIGEQVETMHAVYNKTCLEPIRTQLMEGKLKASGFYDKMRVCYVGEAVLRQFDPDLRSFMNVNTPDDLEAARRLIVE